jgi:splicing factor U2AF subunit
MQIKEFKMIKDPLSNGASAVVEYENSKVTDGAISGLNGLALGASVLSVQRVPQQMAQLLLKPTAASQTSSTTSSVPIYAKRVLSSPMDDLLSTLSPTCVIRLSNMTNLEELRDDELFEELREDVNDECNNHGTVLSIVIPRPTCAAGDERGAEIDIENGVGQVFVQFTSPEGASRAKGTIHGRSFNGEKVKVVFYPEKLYHDKVCHTTYAH